MPDGLYERDALVWAETQADLLRRLAAGERVNASIDWPNVIEEVQDVGLSELRACRSLLEQGLRHLLKQRAWPASDAVLHWREEALAMLLDSNGAFTPSMRRRIDVPDLYARAMKYVRRLTDQSGLPAELPEACPFDLDELLEGNVDALLAKLSP